MEHEAKAQAQASTSTSASTSTHPLQDVPLNDNNNSDAAAADDVQQTPRNWVKFDDETDSSEKNNNSNSGDATQQQQQQQQNKLALPPPPPSVVSSNNNRRARSRSPHDQSTAAAPIPVQVSLSPSLCHGNHWRVSLALFATPSASLSLSLLMVTQRNAFQCIQYCACLPLPPTLPAPTPCFLPYRCVSCYCCSFFLLFPLPNGVVSSGTLPYSPPLYIWAHCTHDKWSCRPTLITHLAAKKEPERERGWAGFRRQEKS